ncbi:unnamed protein product, partial [Tetraodon nigroviridis]
EMAEQSLLNKLIRHSLVHSSNQVEVLQRDPSSPLYSVKSFEELRLKPELLKGVYQMGFNRPSRIQENALPLMMAQPAQNLIAQSQSGTGKTAAFCLAMLGIVNPADKWPQCLCIAPTYELALQIGQVLEQMGRFCADVRLVYAVRGNRIVRGTKVQEQIVVGTPGTVYDWCAKQKVLDPKKITMFVLDEADVMISMQGHRDQSIRIQRWVLLALLLWGSSVGPPPPPPPLRLLPKGCQMLFFSATFEDSVWEFAERIIPEPNYIRLKREEETLDNIRQFYIMCGSKEEKFSALCNLYGCLTIAQTIVFCQTRRMASWLAESMTREGHQVGVLSGEMTVEQRAAVIERYREGKEKVLVTTNVCSRAAGLRRRLHPSGIDVEQVTLVVNFDLPVDLKGRADNDTYLHRIGRSGRFGKRGFAVNLVDSQRSMDIIRQIEAHFDRKIRKLDLEELDDLEEL